MMNLEGSCHCGKVRLGFDSHTPYPYRFCYCTRCLKTHGGIGGVASVMGEADTLRVEGSEDVCVYTVFSNPPGPDIPPVELRLHDCRHCGGHLYIYSPSWSRWIYAAASAIDTELPVPPEYFHIHLSQKPDWIPVPEGPGHVHFEAVPEESMEDWHRRHGLYS